MSTPKDFSKKQPWSSVLQKSECETVAINIMVILSRTGDNFRALSWPEYRHERRKDGNFTESEKAYFKQVVEYCKSEDTARLFSDVWKEL